MAVEESISIHSIVRPQTTSKIEWCRFLPFCGTGIVLFYTPSFKSIHFRSICVKEATYKLTYLAWIALIDKNPPLIKMADIISSLSELYGLSGVALFATIGFTTSIQLKYLRQHIESTCLERERTIHSSPVSRWKRDHSILLRKISCIQKCFGPFLFVFIVYIFVNLISHAFRLTNAIYHLNRPPSSYIFISLNILRNVLNLFLLTLVSIAIEKEV